MEEFVRILELKFKLDDLGPIEHQGLIRYLDSLRAPLESRHVFSSLEKYSHAHAEYQHKIGSNDLLRLTYNIAIEKFTDKLIQFIRQCSIRLEQAKFGPSNEPPFFRSNFADIANYFPLEMVLSKHEETHGALESVLRTAKIPDQYKSMLLKMRLNLVGWSCLLGSEKLFSYLMIIRVVSSEIRRGGSVASIPTNLWLTTYYRHGLNLQQLLSMLPRSSLKLLESNLMRIGLLPQVQIAPSPLANPWGIMDWLGLPIYAVARVYHYFAPENKAIVTPAEVKYEPLAAAASAADVAPPAELAAAPALSVEAEEKKQERVVNKRQSKRNMKATEHSIANEVALEAKYHKFKSKLVVRFSTPEELDAAVGTILIALTSDQAIEAKNFLKTAKFRSGINLDRLIYEVNRGVMRGNEELKDRIKAIFFPPRIDIQKLLREEAAKQQQEEHLRREQEAKEKAEARQRRKEEQARIKALEEVRRKEEAQQRALEETRRRDLEAQERVLEEDRRREAEARQKALEEERRRDEAARQNEHEQEPQVEGTPDLRIDVATTGGSSVFSCREESQAAASVVYSPATVSEDDEQPGAQAEQKRDKSPEQIYQYTIVPHPIAQQIEKPIDLWVLQILGSLIQQGILDPRTEVFRASSQNFKGNFPDSAPWSDHDIALMVPMQGRRAVIEAFLIAGGQQPSYDELDKLKAGNVLLKDCTFCSETTTVQLLYRYPGGKSVKIDLALSACHPVQSLQGQRVLYNTSVLKPINILAHVSPFVLCSPKAYQYGFVEGVVAACDPARIPTFKFHEFGLLIRMSIYYSKYPSAVASSVEPGQPRRLFEPATFAKLKECTTSEDGMHEIRRSIENLVKDGVSLKDIHQYFIRYIPQVMYFERAVDEAVRTKLNLKMRRQEYTGVNDLRHYLGWVGNLIQSAQRELDQERRVESPYETGHYPAPARPDGPHQARRRDRYPATRFLDRPLVVARKAQAEHQPPLVALANGSAAARKKY